MKNSAMASMQCSGRMWSVQRQRRPATQSRFCASAAACKTTPLGQSWKNLQSPALPQHLTFFETTWHLFNSVRSVSNTHTKAFFSTKSDSKSDSLAQTEPSLPIPTTEHPFVLLRNNDFCVQSDQASIFANVLSLWRHISKHSLAFFKDILKLRKLRMAEAQAQIAMIKAKEKNPDGSLKSIVGTQFIPFTDKLFIKRTSLHTRRALGFLVFLALPFAGFFIPVAIYVQPSITPSFLWTPEIKVSCIFGFSCSFFFFFFFFFFNHLMYFYPKKKKKIKKIVVGKNEC